MRKFALATAAAVALAFSAPAFTAPAFAQDTGVKVKIKSGEGMTKKKVVIRGDRGRHEGWRHRDVKKVVIHRDRGRHEGWRHRDAGNKTVVIKKRGHEGSKTIIKKKFEG